MLKFMQMKQSLWAGHMRIKIILITCICGKVSALDEIKERFLKKCGNIKLPPVRLEVLFNNRFFWGGDNHVPGLALKVF